MDRAERKPDQVEIFQRILNAHQMGIWTALPGIVKAYRANEAVVDVQLAIQMQVKAPDPEGTKQWIKIAMLPDVPVVFARAGGFSLTFPVAVGDECLVLFASRCIDTWYESGGEDNQQAEFRMHDLSDGFAVFGLTSLPRALSPAPSTTDVELRTDDAATKISIKADGSILLKSPVNVTIDTPTVHMTGNLQVDGDIHADGDVVADTVSLHDHIHHGVDRGSQDTDPPTP